MEQKPSAEHAGSADMKRQKGHERRVGDGKEAEISLREEADEFAQTSRRTVGGDDNGGEEKKRSRKEENGKGDVEI